MEGIVSKMRVLQGKGEQGSQTWKDAMTEYAEKIEFYDLPIKIDQKRFIERLNTRIVEIIGRQWDFWYGLTLKYKDDFGDANVPDGYKTSEGFALGAWQSRQRRLFKKGKLSSDKIKHLQEIGFSWERLEEIFEKGFFETLLYNKSTGNPNVPDGYKTPEGYLLGGWQSYQRTRQRKGKLSLDKIKRLKEIGFIWEKLEEHFEKGFQETFSCKRSTGNPNVLNVYKTPEGFPLGRWQDSQRNLYKEEKLSSDRIKRLEDIGFTWGKFEEQFEKGFQETLLYRNRTGIPNASLGYITSGGFRLGKWQSKKKEHYKSGRLSSDRIRRFEEIGFTWENIEDKFEEGFQETLLHKKSTGNANVPSKYKTPEGYGLGNWQDHKRRIYKKGELSTDKIKRLEEIGFTWDKLEEKFEKGFKETLLYRKKTDNPNAPVRYKTSDGFGLGIWQSNQRISNRKGKLSSDRIKRLDEIGFKWEM